MDFENYSDSFETLLMSDEHWDNAHCDLRLLKKHHEQAVVKNSPIFKFGDLFCAMQGKWDKRADQNQLRPEHRGNNYLDQLITTAEEWYTPYAKNIALITDGNHENSVQLRHQTSLLERLTDRLHCLHGSYWGFIIFRFAMKGNQKASVSKTMHFHHGYGGGGEVTRGLIDHSRTRGQYRADIYVSGHIHRRNSEENVITEVVPNSRSIRQKRELFLRSSTYKNEVDGWHAETGKAARPLGGWWLKFNPAKEPCKTGKYSAFSVDFVESRAV